jgi:hypothetical protein
MPLPIIVPFVTRLQNATNFVIVFVMLAVQTAFFTYMHDWAQYNRLPEPIVLSNNIVYVVAFMIFVSLVSIGRTLNHNPGPQQSALPETKKPRS